MVVTSTSSVTLRAIGDDDIARAATFLHTHHSSRVGVHDWERAMAPPWSVDQPNHGFLLDEGDRVVGVHLALYSERRIDDRREPFCNLAAWCVLPSTGITAFDCSAHSSLKGVSLHGPLAERQRGWAESPTALHVARHGNSARPEPSAPQITRHGSALRLLSEPSEISEQLSGPERELYEDHAGAAAAHHLVLAREADTCYVVFRRDRRKNLPLFASLIYVGDPMLFRAANGWSTGTCSPASDPVHARRAAREWGRARAGPSAPLPEAEDVP